MRKKQAMILIMLACALGSAAQAAPYQERGTWYFDFIGIPFAKLWVGIDEQPERYTLESSFKSRGIVRVFKKLKTYSVAEGVRTDDGHMQGLLFDYHSKGEGKRTNLVYNAAGELVQREVEPEDDPNWRPRVPAEKVADAYSPADVVFAVREQLQADDSNKQLQFKLYDGQRLSKITLRHVKDARIRLRSGELADTFVYAATRELIDGYTPKEIKRYHEGEPEVLLYVRQSDAFPVMLQADIGYGQLRAQWAAE